MGAQPAFQHVTARNTLVAVWTGDPTVDQRARLKAGSDQLALNWRGGIHVLNVISEVTGMPDPPARELLRKQFESVRGRVLSLALVLEKRGILASPSRAILSTLLTLSGRPFEMVIYTSRSDAADWL